MFAVDVSQVLSYAENRSVDMYAQKLFNLYVVMEYDQISQGAQCI